MSYIIKPSRLVLLYLFWLFTCVRSQNATSSSTHYSLFTNTSPMCQGTCIFYYLSTGYHWMTSTSITTLTITEGDLLTATTTQASVITPAPDDTWVIALTSVSSGQMGFSAAGQPSYGASTPVEYTTTFTLTRSNGDVQRYDGFFTITPPTDTHLTTKSCTNQYGNIGYCCDAGYTTNFNLSYSGILVTRGPTDYFPQIPGLNTQNCSTTKLGGIPFTKQTVMMLTSYHVIPKMSAGSVVAQSTSTTASTPTSAIEVQTMVINYADSRDYPAVTSTYTYTSYAETSTSSSSVSSSSTSDSMITPFTGSSTTQQTSTTSSPHSSQPTVATSSRPNKALRMFIPLQIIFLCLSIAITPIIFM